MTRWNEGVGRNAKRRVRHRDYETETIEVDITSPAPAANGFQANSGRVRQNLEELLGRNSSGNGNN
jgi:hypothetical protein